MTQQYRPKKRFRLQGGPFNGQEVFTSQDIPVGATLTLQEHGGARYVRTNSHRVLVYIEIPKAFPGIVLPGQA